MSNVHARPRRRPTNFPTDWLGEWVAPDGRVMLIERVGSSLHVTVRPRAGAEPFSDPSADALPAEWMDLGKRGRGLRVEVGAAEGQAGLGPTYDLVFVHDPDDRPAKATDALTEIHAEPNVRMGLYDDYGDDLGVPWAMPLERWEPRGTPRP